MRKKEMYLKEVKDINFACILKIKGYKLHGFQWVGKDGYWLFEDNDHTAESEIQNYINNGFEANITKYIEARKLLLQIMSDNKK